jgi:hypothetical protein
VFFNWAAGKAMSRYDNVREVLACASELIADLKAEYDEARRNEAVGVSRVKIKHAVELIRSALEYTAQDVWCSYTTEHNRVFFPYGKDEAHFLASVKRNLPGVDLQAPKLYEIISSAQPHSCADSWLIDLCIVSNFNKHNGLSRQSRQVSDNSTITLGDVAKVSGNAAITIGECYQDGVAILKPGPLVLSNRRGIAEAKKQVSDGISLIQEFDWVEFHIESSDGDALKLLQTSHVNASEIIESIYKEINC